MKCNSNQKWTSDKSWYKRKYNIKQCACEKLIFVMLVRVIMKMVNI